MKTLRFIGMAISAIIMSVNFIACSSDDNNDNENTNLLGTWKCSSTLPYEEHTAAQGGDGFREGLKIKFHLCPLNKFKT